MCQIIDYSIFNSFGTYSLEGDEGKSGQKNKILGMLEYIIENLKLQKLVKIREKKTRFYGIVFQVRDKLDVMLEILFEENCVTLTVKNIQSSKLFMISDKVNKLLVAKQIFRSSFNLAPEQPKIIFSPQSGQISIREKMRISENNLKEQQKYFNRQIKILVDKSVTLFNFLQKICSTKNDLNLEGSLIIQRKIFPILRYLLRSTVQPSFQMRSECAEYGLLVKTQRASNFDLQGLIKINSNSFQNTVAYFRNLNMYGLNYEVVNKNIFMSDMMFSQKENIQMQINIPSLPILRPNQNKFLFNHCYFFSNKYSQTKIQEGGNSQIYVMRAQVFEYSTSTHEKDKVFKKNPKISQYVSKHLVHKKHKNIQIEKISMYREHQAQVLSYIREGTCLYLPKYYLNVQKASQYHNKFFMDYIPGETLDKFMQLNSYTISTLTKLWLMFQVSQALRFITQFGIVHLDVKEANVMVIKKLICKLIDFGEAYHFRICDNSHRPKYSLIYGSPQVVTNQTGRGFSEKSDVYSLGIMMSNVFFGKYPYFFSNQKAFQSANFKKDLPKKTFYTPQDFDERGDQIIMIILSQLILKCIQMDEKARPFIDWVGLILKNCLNYLIRE